MAAMKSKIASNIQIQYMGTEPPRYQLKTFSVVVIGRAIRSIHTAEFLAQDALNR